MAGIQPRSDLFLRFGDSGLVLHRSGIPVHALFPNPFAVSRDQASGWICASDRHPASARRRGTRLLVSSFKEPTNRTP